MDRVKMHEWISKAEMIFNKHTLLVDCPNDKNHKLSYSIIPYVEFSKVELILECKDCNIKRTFTTSLPDLSGRTKAFDSSSNPLDGSSTPPDGASMP